MFILDLPSRALSFRILNLNATQIINSPSVFSSLQQAIAVAAGQLAGSNGQDSLFLAELSTREKGRNQAPTLFNSSELVNFFINS